MRFLVLLLGLAAAAGAVGAGGYLLVMVLPELLFVPPGAGRMSAPKQLEQDQIFNATVLSAGFFVVGAVLAFFGAVFAMFRSKKSAAVLFLVAAAGPAVLLVMSPLLGQIERIAPALGASGFLVFVAVLTLLIKPKRAALED